jgi:hypothetical protein
LCGGDTVRLSFSRSTEVDMRKAFSLPLVSLPLVVSVAGCSSGGGVERFALALTLPNEASISRVTYTVHAGMPSGIPDVTGTIATPAGTSASAFVSFPPSTGNTVTLDAQTSTGETCRGVSGPFSVAPGVGTTVQMQVFCGNSTAATSAGAVMVSTSFVKGNACPQFTSWRISPLQVSIGARIDAEVTADDADDPSTSLTYQWIAPGTPPGAFSSPTGPSTQFTCYTRFDPLAPPPPSETIQLGVSVSDQKCTTAAFFNVTCVSEPQLCPPAADPALCELPATAQGMCFHTTTPDNAGTTDVAKFGCNGFSGAEAGNCRSLLHCLRASHCAGGLTLDDPTPCLCGNLTAQQCFQGGAAKAPGPCRDEYIRAGLPNVFGDIFGQFTDPSSPIGIANNLYTCDLDVPCPLSCF